MKKTILIISFLVISTCAKSQITQTNNFNSYRTLLAMSYNTKSMAFAPNCNSVEIYNEDFVWEKIITGLPTFEGIYLVSKNLFTISGKYDLILGIKNSSTNKTEFKLYNEDGQFLFDFGLWQPYHVSRNKLLTYLPVFPGDGTYYNDIKIYSLPGQLNAPIGPNVNTPKSIAFPNPADNFINISYSVNKMEEIQIIDIKGNIIENILLDPSLSTININTSSYPKGMYIYKIGNTNGKFIVK